MSEPSTPTPAASFAEMAAAMTQTARFERQRIDIAEPHARACNASYPGSVEIGSWLRRAELLTQAAEVLTVLASHEKAARALDPLLAR